MPDLCDLGIKQFHDIIYERFPLFNILSATKFLEVIRVYLKDANNCEICLCKFATTTLSGSFFLCYLQIACINLQGGYKNLSRPGEHMTLADFTDPLGNLLCSELTPTS